MEDSIFFKIPSWSYVLAADTTEHLDLYFLFIE